MRMARTPCLCQVSKPPLGSVHPSRDIHSKGDGKSDIRKGTMSTVKKQGLRLATPKGSPSPVDMLCKRPKPYRPGEGLGGQET